MTTPEPDIASDEYPSAWRPRERVDLDIANAPLQSEEVELFLATMSPTERAEMMSRIDAARRR